MRILRISLFLITSIIGIVSFSQPKQDKATDSLEKALTLQKNEDTLKVNTLIALCRAHFSISPIEGVTYGQQALDLAQKLNYVKGQAYALKYMGNCYYFQGKSVENLDHWLRSLDLFRSINDKLGISSLMNNIGSLYNDKADYVKALEYLLPSLTIAEEIGDKLRIATALQNIGNTYSNKEATKPQALKYFFRALTLSEELQDEEAIVTVSTNIGEIYLAIGKVDSALIILKKGLKATKNKEVINTNFILNDLGKAYAKKGNYDLAISYQKQAIEIAKKVNATQYVGKSLLSLADTYFAQGNVELSMAAYKEAEPLLKDAHAVEDLKDTYVGLTKTYSKLGDDKKAFIYLSLVDNLKDTLYNIDRDKKMSSLQFDFDITKKQSQINLLTKDQALKELDLQKQKATRNAFAIAFGLILVIAFVIYRGYRQKVKTNFILDKQKVQIENLMLNILPEEVATELQEQGHATPRYYESVSVLFTDFKSFTSLADKMTAKELIEELNDSFIAFDDIIVRNDLEKIKTIGDSYMCAGGIPTPTPNHAMNMVKAGLEIQEYIKDKNRKRIAMGLPPWELRVGIHVGPIVAGVVGKKKYAYDIWGNTVNVASRMESNGEPGKVNISASTYALVKDKYSCTHRGKISAKNVGEIDMYFVD